MMPSGSDPLSIDRSQFSVVPLARSGDDLAYWLTRPAEERLLAIEAQRLIVYGRIRAAARLQRVLEVAERASRQDEQARGRTPSGSRRPRPLAVIRFPRRPSVRAFARAKRCPRYWLGHASGVALIGSNTFLLRSDSCSVTSSSEPGVSALRTSSAPPGCAEPDHRPDLAGRRRRRGYAGCRAGCRTSLGKPGQFL